MVQAVFAARDVPLPRDSDQQLGAGLEVRLDATGRGYEAGDLLFFAEQGRVAHVAIWAGAGRIVHSALSRGGVARDDLFGDSALALRLRDGLVGVRRPAP
jgi:cell wall-associated NlpC family hydrolase